MKFWVVILIVFLAACSAPPTPLPVSTETPVPPTSTARYVVITRVVKRAVVVTATPQPLLAQDCINTAMTQSELTGCGALEWELAKEKLDRLISRIEFSPEDKEIFDQLQAEWQKQVEQNCEFFYGQFIADENGNLYYKGGSMAPMQRNFCMAEQYKRRIEDLKFAYFNY